MIQGKICSQCDEWKPYEKFGIKNSEKDGYRASCKECQKKYKQANKEKIAEYQKEYFQKTKEKAREYNRQYYHANKERIAEKRNENPVNKEKIAERNKRYYQLNKEKFAEWNRKNEKKYVESRKAYQSRPENKAKVAERIRKYSQTEKGKETSYKKRVKRRSHKHDVRFTPHERSQILERDNWKCRYCGTKVHDESQGNWNTPNKAHIDHIVPISKGGDSTPDNLQVLCRTCNLSKSDKEQKHQTS